MISLLKFELRKHMNKAILIGFAIFIICACLVHQAGIAKFEGEKERLKEFVDVEETKINLYVNYVQYGIYGFYVNLKPSAIWTMFHNSSTLGGLQGYIDSGVRLSFSKPQSGENIFDKLCGGVLDYSWFISTIGSIFVILLGFLAFRDKEYILSIAKMSGLKKAWGAIIISRLLIILGAISIMAIVTFFQFIGNGYMLENSEIVELIAGYIYFYMSMIILMAISAGLGTIKNWKTCITTGVVLWLMWGLLLPEVVGTVYSIRIEKDIKSRYQHEIQKIGILMKFEEKALQEARDKRYVTKEQKTEVDRKNGEYYWQNQYKQVEKLEKEMLDRIANTADSFQFISAFFPSILGKEVYNEVSSMGFNTYKEFYKHNRELQKGFLRYYLDKRFNENYSKVTPYLKPGENVIKARSSLPNYLILGFFMNLLYLTISLIIDFKVLKKSLFWVENDDALTGLEIEIPFNEITQLSTSFSDVKQIIVKNMFEPTGNIAILNDKGEYFYTKDFFYLSSNGFSEQSRVKDVVTYVNSNLESKVELDEKYINKKISDFQGLELEDFMLSIAECTTGKVIVFDEFLPFEKYVNFQYSNEIKDIEARFNTLRATSAVVLLRKKTFAFPLDTNIVSFHSEDGKLTIKAMKKYC